MNRKSLFVPILITVKILLIFLILYFNMGMFGFDAYIHHQYVDAILTNGHIVEISFVEPYYEFVGFHIFASALSSFTGLNSEMLYEFVSIIIPILIFDLTILAFIRHIDRKRKGYVSNDINLKYLSLILLFPSMIGLQMLFGRPNTLGISLFSLCLYLYLCKPERFRAQILGSILAIVTLKVHHLSAVYLLPVIFFTSIFLVKNYKSILSMVYAIPAVIIVETILNSRVFETVNFFFTKNEFYANLYNLFIKNDFVFLIIWLVITLLGYFIRTRYGKKISRFFSTQKYTKFVVFGVILSLIVTEIVGLFSYTASLSSWFVSVELVLIFALSGLALIRNNNIKISLFFLGFFFYGLTVVFSWIFGATEHELSWVAPRTFVFTVIFISFLAYLAISDILPTIKRKWKTIFLASLLFNSYLSYAYMGDQYLPGYNMMNNSQNLTIAYSISSVIDINSSSVSIPFSISKFLIGAEIYRLPVIFDANSSLQENAERLKRSYLTYIVIGKVMDQWLGVPLHLSNEDITYYLGVLYYSQPTLHVVINNNYNYLLYHFR